MELRDYLMPGEYILGTIRNINIDYRFSNLAITNKRFIVFNVKKKRSLFKSWEEVTDLKSVFFEGFCGVQLIYDNDIKKWVHIDLCEKIWYNPQKRIYACYSNKNAMEIYPKLRGPSIRDILDTLIGIFNSLSPKESSLYEDERLIEKTFLLKDDDECIK